jgi:hypothetical protein
VRLWVRRRGRLCRVRVLSEKGCILRAPGGRCWAHRPEKPRIETPRNAPDLAGWTRSGLRSAPG